MIEKKDYVYGGPAPLAHQRRIFLKTRDWPVYANLSEQGTGKTKIFIDTACWLYNKGDIDAVVVVAPNGVHCNWVENELPVHFPGHTEYFAAAYHSAPSSKQRKLMEHLWDESRVLYFLCINIEALSGKRAKEYVRKFLNARRCLFIIDESHKIKTPGVARTKACQLLSKHAVYKRIATGTPATENPLAFFTQMRFLDPAILGFDNFYSFKAQYAVMEDGFNYRSKKKYSTVVGYKNIDELMEKINKVSDRVLKKDCVDLPDKVYERRIVEITKEQRQLYNDILNKVKVELQGQEITSTLAMTRLMQAQQVLGGFILSPSTHRPIKVGEVNPKINALKDILEDCTRKVIIYARFKAEISAISIALKALYGNGAVIEYHGSVKKKEKQQATSEFQGNDEVQFIIVQQSSAVGVTWTAATTVIYYSNEFSLLTRLQSEDRPHRIGQTNKVTYWDLYVPGTVDEKVLLALIDKKEFSEALLDDPITEWVTL